MRLSWGALCANTETAEQQASASGVRRKQKGYGPWIVTFSDELMLAIRKLQCPNSERSQGHPSFPLEMDPEANPLDIVKAKWYDGYTSEVPGLTYERLAALTRSSSSAGQGPLWVGEHAPTKHKLEIRQRSCRELYVSLYEQTRQITSTRVALFGQMERNDGCVISNEDPLILKAKAFLIPIAERYSRGEIEQDKLNAERDKEYVKIGLMGATQKRNRSKADLLKRPACKSEPSIGADSHQPKAKVKREPNENTRSEAGAGLKQEKNAKIKNEANASGKKEAKANTKTEKRVKREADGAPGQHASIKQNKCVNIFFIKTHHTHFC